MEISSHVPFSIFLVVVLHSAFGVDTKELDGKHYTEHFQDTIKSTSLNHAGSQKALHQFLSSIPQREWTRLAQATSAYGNLSNFVLRVLENATGVSGDCLESTLQVAWGLARKEMWAFKVIDAYGKMQSSLLRDFRSWSLGSYSECVELDQKEMNRTIFKGQYCILAIPFTLQAHHLVYKEAMCTPKACNATEISSLIKFFFAEVNELIRLPFNSKSPVFHPAVYCQNPDRLYDGKAVGAIVVLAIFLFAITMATLYDLFNNTRKSDCNDGDVELILKEKTSSGCCDKIMLSFSAYNNLRKIMGTSQPVSALTCLNGIRFLSMSWVILGHTLALSTLPILAIGNLGDVPLILQRWATTGIANATVSVDTFFVLSGLLVSYLCLKELDKMKKASLMSHVKFWLMYYVHRYLRLTPAYMLVLMVYYCLLPYMGYGPLWKEDFDPACKSNWWTNLLYINNVVSSDRQCMAWSWYLANDMQFYVIAPLMVLPLFKSGLLGTMIVAVVAISSLVSRGVISELNGFGPGGFYAPSDHSNSYPDYWDLLYVHPWTRIASYTVGIYVGYLLYKNECKLPIRNPYQRTIFVMFGWAVAAFFCLATLYGIYGPMSGALQGTGSWDTSVSALYNATYRFTWSLGVGWVIFACCTGNGGYVNDLLSWKGMLPLSRLTYCAYLVHPAVMAWYYYSQQTIIMLTDQNIIYFFFGHLVASYLVGLAAALMFESPMLGLEKAVFGNLR